MKMNRFVLIVLFLALCSISANAYERDNYRIGLGLDVISPSKDILINKYTTVGVNFNLEARANDFLDAGARYGLVYFHPKTSNYDATYAIYKAGIGGRYYIVPTGSSAQNSRGLMNFFVDLEADYYQASKVQEVMANSPAEFTGWGATGLVGIEMALGSISGYLSAGYQRTSIKSSDSKELPLDGFVVQFGTIFGFVK